MNNILIMLNTLTGFSLYLHVLMKLNKTKFKKQGDFMFGWLIYKISDTIRTTTNSQNQCKNITVGDLCIEYMRYSKFGKEQILYFDEHSILVTEGVLLNSKDIIAETGKDDLTEALLSMFYNNELQCLRHLNGPYCGVYHDNNRTTIFTNRIGDRPVYYYNSGKERIASSNINMLITFCHHHDLPLTFDPIAGDMMLELGFMADTCTMAKEIKRIFPGECIIWEDFKQYSEQYYMYDNTCDNSITLQDAIEDVDRLFCKAVKLCFDKDIEYGYKHVADLSGGLDSRMTTWVARELGYGPFLNLNWGMPGCEDYRIASQIAAYVGNDFMFKSLDGLNCFYDIDEAVKRNYGAALYIGPTEALRLAKTMNTDQYGLKHTGQLGDVIVGAFVESKVHENPTNTSVIGYSSIRNSMNPHWKYQNIEQMRFYIRGFLGVTNSSQLQNEFWPLVSPFLDNDLMEYCLKIPLKYRVGHFLYYQWIKQKHPEILKFRREGSLLSIKNTYMHPQIASFINRASNKIKRDAQTMKYKLRISKYRYRLYGMTPLDAVYERYPDVRQFMQQYFIKNIKVFESFSEYKDRITKKFQVGNVIEKSMVLTLLSFVGQHKIWVEVPQRHD